MTASDLTARLSEQEQRIRAFLGLDAAKPLGFYDRDAEAFTDAVCARFSGFNIEICPIPSTGMVPLDAAYFQRLYPRRGAEFERTTLREAASCKEALVRGHARYQGRLLGVETTMKPCYLPGGRQHYGTAYGFEPTADPFQPYFGQAGLSHSRYSHNYASLARLVAAVEDDWRSREFLPAGYKVSLCPPSVFNLVGTVLHPEWSQTESLELGFYRDENDNAHCYAVGCNGPGDFSHIHPIATDSDWNLLGFRLAIVPE